MAATRTLSGWFSAVVAGVLVLYPVLVYFGIGRYGPSAVAVLLIVVCLLRLGVMLIRRAPTLATRQAALMTAGAVVLAAASLVLGKPDAMLYYPVLVNATLCVLFSWSLVSPPSAIERIARLREPNLSPAGVRYTRRVTIVWIVFFIVNGGIALYTVLFTPLSTWALYNGFIAYLLIGAVFGVEFLVRSIVLRGRS